MVKRVFGCGTKNLRKSSNIPFVRLSGMIHTPMRGRGLPSGAARMVPRHVLVSKFDERIVYRLPARSYARVRIKNNAHDVAFFSRSDFNWDSFKQSLYVAMWPYLVEVWNSTVSTDVLHDVLIVGAFHQQYFTAQFSAHLDSLAGGNCHFIFRKNRWGNFVTPAR